MNSTPSEQEIRDMMDDAFSGELDSASKKELEAWLQTHPDYQKLWKENQSIREAMLALEKESSPSEFSDAKILRAAAEKTKPSKGLSLSSTWRFLLSQPIVAAATVVVIVGVGIYSQFWLKSQEKETLAPTDFRTLEQSAPSGLKPEEETLAAPPPPSLPLPQEKARAFPRKKDKSPLADTLAEPAPPPGGGTSGMVPAKAKEAPKPEAKEWVAPPEKAQTLTPAVGGAPTKALTNGERTAPVPPRTQASIRHQQLMDSAKKNMKLGNYQAALQDLLQAQKLQDSEELRNLIAQCRAEIRLIESQP